jgi:hypothetical protein
MTTILSLLSPSKKTIMHYVMQSMQSTPIKGEKMIETGLILTGSDAELLSRALAEVKTKAYEESETSLDDNQALDTLVSRFRSAESDGQQKERRHSYLSPLRKRLVLGTIIERQGGMDSRKA